MRLGLWAGMTVAVVLSLGVCENEEWRRDGAREAESAGRWGLVVGVASSTALAIRYGRRPRSGRPPMSPPTPTILGLAIVCRAVGALSCMWAGLLASLFATALIWPRELLTLKPLDSPDTVSLMLLTVFVGPPLVITILLGVFFSTGAARRLHPYGNVGWQEAVAALFAASMGGLIFVR